MRMVAASSQFFFQSIGLDWRLAATWRSVYIHQMNRMNSRDDFGLDDSIINIILLIIIILLLFLIVIVTLLRPMFSYCHRV